MGGGVKDRQVFPGANFFPDIRKSLKTTTSCNSINNKIFTSGYYLKTREKLLFRSIQRPLYGSKDKKAITLRFTKVAAK